MKKNKFRGSDTRSKGDERLLTIKLYETTLGRWNDHRSTLKMTHDSFAAFLLNLYDSSLIKEEGNDENENSNNNKTDWSNNFDSNINNNIINNNSHISSNSNLHDSNIDIRNNDISCIDDSNINSNCNRNMDGVGWNVKEETPEECLLEANLPVCLETSAEKLNNYRIQEMANDMHTDTASKQISVIVTNGVWYTSHLEARLQAYPGESMSCHNFNNQQNLESRMQPHIQVLDRQCASLDMPPLVMGSTNQYLLHTLKPCTWESEEVFSCFHQETISKYNSSWNLFDKEDLENETIDIIQTVDYIMKDMVDMVEMVIEMEEDENENSYDEEDVDNDDEWCPNLDKKEFKESGSESDLDSIGDQDDDEWNSKQLKDDCNTGLRKGKFICNNCGKSIVGRNNLKVHQQSSMCVNGPESCDECGKSFPKPGQLYRHKRVVHAKKKPHVCPYCEKSFFQECALTRHVRIHTDDRPFKCDYCERGFAQKTQLKCHLRVHTHEKPYKCNNCDASFAHNVSLKNHTKKHHSR